MHDGRESNGECVKVSFSEFSFVYRGRACVVGRANVGYWWEKCRGIIVCGVFMHIEFYVFLKGIWL